jgi:hypothetical protein
MILEPNSTRVQNLPIGTAYYSIDYCREWSAISVQIELDLGQIAPD